jgi:hypothetical protein
MTKIPNPYYNINYDFKYHDKQLGTGTFDIYLDKPIRGSMGNAYSELSLFSIGRVIHYPSYIWMYRIEIYTGYNSKIAGGEYIEIICVD